MERNMEGKNSKQKLKFSTGGYVRKFYQFMKILENSECLRCKMAEETIAHAIRDCIYAAEVWHYSSVKVQWLKAQ